MQRFWIVFFLFAITLFSFLLLSCSDPETYTFAVVGDFQQPSGHGYKKVSHEIANRIASGKATFVVIVGDLISGTGDYKWDQFDHLVKPIHDANKEIYAVIGNNDCGSETMVEGFEERFGERFQIICKTGLTLVLLDSEMQPNILRDFQLRSNQIEWLERRPWKIDCDINPDPLLFVFVHRPIYRSKIMQLDKGMRYGRDKPEIASLLNNIGTDVVFSGHEHIFQKNKKDNVTYFITGGGGGDLLKTGFHHYLLVTVCPNKRKWKVKVVKVKTDEKPKYKTRF